MHVIPAWGPTKEREHLSVLLIVPLFRSVFRSNSNNATKGFVSSLLCWGLLLTSVWSVPPSQLPS